MAPPLPAAGLLPRRSASLSASQPLAPGPHAQPVTSHYPSSAWEEHLARVPAGPGGEFRLDFKPELSNIMLWSENAGACLGAAGSNECATARGPVTVAKQVAPGP